MGIIVGVGGSGTYTNASGGKVYGYTSIGTTPQVVALPNPSRQKITFHNPGGNDILVAPSVASNYITGAQTPFVPTTTLYGGCFRVFGNGGTLVIEGECQIGWQAFALTGSANQFTVMESNIG